MKHPYSFYGMMIIFLLLSTACGQRTTTENNHVVDNSTQQQSPKKDEINDKNSEFTKQVAIEILNKYHQQFNKLENDRNTSGKLQSYTSMDELEQNMANSTSKSWASTLINTYFTKEESGIYLKAMDEPLWLNENQPVEVKKEDETHAVLIQEQNNELIGHVEVAFHFQLTSGKWLINRVNKNELKQLSKQDAEELVRKTVHVDEGVKVQFDHMEQASFIIHVFKTVNNHTATIGWYSVNPTTKKITNIMTDESNMNILNKAKEILTAISNNDLQRLATFVHPEEGLLFSPYVYINEDSLTFKKEDIPTILKDKQRYRWGTYDGSGKPITLTPEEYFNQFVYTHPYKQTDKIILDNLQQRGNTKNNINQFFPESHTVEFYYQGSAENNHMDWGSLILVLQKDQSNHLKLVAIVNDQWTI